VQAVAVEAPDERPDDLPYRREPDDREGLEPNGARLKHEKCCEDEGREDAEPELSAAPDVPVGREHRDDGRDDRHEREERKPAHSLHLRRNGGGRFDRGTQGRTPDTPIGLA